VTDDDEMLILDAIGRLEARLSRLENGLAQLRMVFEHEFALLEMNLNMMVTEVGQQADQLHQMATHRRRMLDACAARLRTRADSSGRPDPMA